MKDGVNSINSEEYKKRDRERKRKPTELNPEELLATQKRGKVATRQWRAQQNATISGSTSSSELLSQHTNNGPPY